MADSAIPEEYGLNIGRFMADHEKDWVISAGFEGRGFEARRRDSSGRGYGTRYAALTLDELAALLADAVVSS
jgi:hypothetical protein